MADHAYTVSPHTSSVCALLICSRVTRSYLSFKLIKTVRQRQTTSATILSEQITQKGCFVSFSINSLLDLLTQTSQQVKRSVF